MLIDVLQFWALWVSIHTRAGNENFVKDFTFFGEGSYTMTLSC